ncbi:hypothetical protein [Pseudarcicella hirudinis]|uniref:hypothetical protein n=1 Tax=Pseudarcicella hirudinis TaxID=1079859 RepID=UPI0011600B21|nr:hypothetical protein [Pseudarcicella hirudinis]
MKVIAWIVLILPETLYGKSITAADSTARKDSLEIQEPLFLVRKSQIDLAINNKIALDSLRIRFELLKLSSKVSLEKAKVIGSQIFQICDDDMKTAGIIIANDKKIRKRLNLKLVLQYIKAPLLGAGLFYLGNIAAQKGLIIKL